MERQCVRRRTTNRLGQTTTRMHRGRLRREMATRRYKILVNQTKCKHKSRWSTHWWKKPSTRTKHPDTNAKLSVQSTANSGTGSTSITNSNKPRWNNNIPNNCDIHIYYTSRTHEWQSSIRRMELQLPTTSVWPKRIKHTTLSRTSRSQKLRLHNKPKWNKRLCNTITCLIVDAGLQMYQFIYPWVHPQMFELHLPQNNSHCKHLDRTICSDADFEAGGSDTEKQHIHTHNGVDRPTIRAQHTDGDVDDRIYNAAAKLVNYIEKRQACVTYHGPNTCSDKKPWATYSHFHITVVAERRLGVDSTYNNAIALHRKVASCHIPASQVTRFPASWANYLSQRPRLLWYSCPEGPISEFASWTQDVYLDRNVPLPVNRKRLFADAPSTSAKNDNPEESMLYMKNGKVQKLYDYLAWQIRQHDYSTREDLIDGALSHGTTDNFSRALIHPHFDTLLAKAFTMDRAVEVNMPFKTHIKNLDWSKYDSNDAYLKTDVSLALFKEILAAQDISHLEFTRDVWELLTLARPKSNLLCLEGVPNSGKSFIARSIAGLYKYQNTCQGTSSFPFMEIANASIGLIEEPVFTADNLQTFKKLAEGTPTDIAVKNRKAARVPRIPLIITSNYDFIVQGGSTEKTAFASRMKKHMFKSACGFLKMAKKMLNPGIWRVLFDTIIPDDIDGSSSDDNELREFLDMQPMRKKSKKDEEREEQMAEAALLCSEPMFEEDEETDWQSMEYLAAQRIQQLNVPTFMNNFSEKDWEQYNQCMHDNVVNMLYENYRKTY